MKTYIEVCYKDEKGTSQRVACEELDRWDFSIPKFQQTLATALAGDILCRDGRIKWQDQVHFPPQNLIWARIIVVDGRKRKQHTDNPFFSGSKTE